MPKYYFTREPISGEVVLYHTAPGQDELHISEGIKFEDVKHLVPPDFDSMAYNNTQPRHPFWDSFIGKFMGGDSGSAAWRMVQVCIAIWGIYQFIGTAKSTLEEIHTTSKTVTQHSMQLDSLRDFEKALGSPRNVLEYQSATNLGLKIANKHFPKDVKEYQQQMQWSTSSAIPFNQDRQQQ